jgi:hypothetical protein
MEFSSTSRRSTAPAGRGKIFGAGLPWAGSTGSFCAASGTDEKKVNPRRIAAVIDSMETAPRMLSRFIISLDSLRRFVTLQIRNSTMSALSDRASQQI